MNELNGNIPSQEMETFLSPEEKSKERVVSKYSLTKDKDVESSEFDPFAERMPQNPTSNMDTLMHLLKASLGTGILAMPKAFKSSGLITGIFFTVIVGVVCTHCSYILVKCAHILYVKTRKTEMTFPQVAQAALENGPKPLRKWANSFRIFIIISLFMTYFGTCSVYTIIVANNIIYVVKYYVLEETMKSLGLRIFLILLLPPLIFMSWIRDLKYLAPVSMIANVFMGLGLGITMYFLVGTGELKTDQISSMLFKSPWEWPEFFSLSIFAVEAIGVVMPLENAMKTPRSMLGLCGVLNKGMTGVCLVYMLLGFLGYLRYGEDVKDSITLTLEGFWYGQVVNIAIAIAVYCTFGLQFFVCIEIMWNGIKDKFTGRPNLTNYVMRTILVTACVLLAIAVPSIAPLMGIIGAFCFSILGLIAPAFIEVITFWNIGFGPGKYLIWKNILVVLFGMFALIFGTKQAITEIIAS